MPVRQVHRRMLAVAVVVAILVVLFIAALVLSQEEQEPGADGATPVTLFMSYIPSVQFAPVYVAVERGYFAAEGIAIQLENNLNEADGVERIASNDLQFGLISGEQVVLARGMGRPIVYVFEWYHSFPVGVVAAAEAGITTPADLAGRIVGIPGRFGASYIGLRALLDAGSLREEDLGELRTIGFTARENVCERKVDASVIYIANEPLTIETECFPVSVIKVSDYATLVSNGLVTNEVTIREHPELVRGMVRALQRGVADVIADPEAAFAIAVPEYVPDLPEEQYATQRQVLQNSVALWASDDIGRTTPAAWEATQQVLLATGLLSQPLEDLTAAYDMSFLPE